MFREVNDDIRAALHVGSVEVDLVLRYLVGHRLERDLVWQVRLHPLQIGREHGERSLEIVLACTEEASHHALLESSINERHALVLGPVLNAPAKLGHQLLQSTMTTLSE